MKEYRFRIGGRQYNVTVNSVAGDVADVCVNGVNYNVEIEDNGAAAGAAARTPEPTGAAEAAEAAEKVAPAKELAGASQKSEDVPSPLPGVIVEICVKEGQSVRRGEKLAVIEAMKMENDILSPIDGTVASIHVSKGDSVLEGARIISIG